ncbi:MAG: hypothetical protein HFJ07_00375 [Lachnospiraceae bacterium]|jgi:hypothetical protein|nr:hypothetical protein [Lachnospiraceae bacterium]
MQEIEEIRQHLLDIYNRIAIQPIECFSSNLFDYNLFSNPLEMVYFIDEIEAYYGILFCEDDIMYEKFSTIELISQIVVKHLQKCR